MPKAFHARLDHTNEELFVHVRRERMFNKIGSHQLETIPVWNAPDLGAFYRSSAFGRIWREDSSSKGHGSSIGLGTEGCLQVKAQDSTRRDQPRSNTLGHMDPNHQIETLLVHADRQTDSSVAPPIYQTSTFRAQTAPEFSAMATDARHERFYTRYGNPTHAQAEAVIAALEGAEAAMLTASGMAAITSAVLGLVSSGDHVIAQRSVYGGTGGFLQGVVSRFGVQVSLVDQTDTDAFKRALQSNTKLLMLESPTNPLMHLTDLRAVATLARTHGIATMIDSTIASPINQRPLEFGIDLVMHSATKYLGGHSDLSAGVLAGSKAMLERIWQTAYLLGATLNGFDSWLLLRGLRTLKLRVEQHNRTALEVARWLERQPRVNTVHYPGLESHPQHQLAKAQMTGFGGVLSFELDGDFAATDALIAKLGLAKRSASFGSMGSLVVHPAAMWAGMMSTEQLQTSGVKPSLVRFAVGLEDVRDIIADLEQALRTV